MIPNFNINGTLPQGIYLTTINEFENRFVYGIKRVELYEGLKKLINDLKIIGCKSIFIDGSYVTNKRLPKDIDVCWDNFGVDLRVAASKMPILFDMAHPRSAQQLMYKCDIFPAYVMETGSKKLFVDFFQQDKNTGLLKGIIKIEIA